MSKIAAPEEILEAAVDRVQDTAHGGFKYSPGSAEHLDAIDAERAADRELAEEIHRRTSLAMV